jgi:uncharacterized protein YjbI with pentapeptide repeats
MNNSFFDNKIFKGINFKNSEIVKGIYEDCQFIDCDLSGCDLSDLTFGECTFDICNLSNLVISNSSLKEVSFKNCKLLGIHFEDCNDILFTVSFFNCNLDYCSFYKKRLKGTIFENCSLTDVDFSESDLQESLFDNCNLAGAIFDRTNLFKSDLSTSYNYSIDPEENRIANAKFSKDGLIGLLEKYNIDLV